MFKRFVMTAVVLAAMISLLAVVAPVAAVGNEKSPALPSQGDQHAFGRNVVVDQPVHGSVQVVGGSAHVGNVIDGDLVVIGGAVSFSGAGRVRGHLIHGGGKVTGAEGRVGGRIYPLSTLEGAAASITRSAVVLALLVAWLIVAVVLTLIGSREIRSSSLEIRASAVHCFALGLVAVTSFVLTAILFSYLVPYLVGVPLLVGLGVFGILTKAYGMVAVFHAVGIIVAGSKTREQLASRRWLRGDLAMVVVGLLILGALRMIPVVGTIIWSTASIFGIGVALATRFGRREPWFLVWRPAEA
jgi:hypothetical protein